MTDWNGDGKRGWHDDYVYNEILNSKKLGTTSLYNGKDSNSTGPTIIILIAIVQ